MNAQKENIPFVDQIAAELLPIIARKSLSDHIPVRVGFSFFYEVSPGWETTLLKRDSRTCVVRNMSDLDEAFADKSIKTILIPERASLTTTAVMQVCKRQAQGKTVFYEVGNYE